MDKNKLKFLASLPLHPKAAFWALAIVSAGSVFFILGSWLEVHQEINRINQSIRQHEIRRSMVKGEKVAKQTVKGVYLTAYSAGNPKKLAEIIKLIDATELNAVVIDIKDYSGKILYDSQLAMVKDLKLKDNRLGNVALIIEKLREHKIYTIARQTVFQDPALAEKRPEWAIKNKSGGVWRDNKGLSWVDPTKLEVWKYNVAIAKEAARLGFDEINFDYVRFPSDGDMSQVVYSNGKNKKYEIMRKFYTFLGKQMDAAPVWISFDMFGLVMEAKGNFDLNIGQRLVDAVDNADYISPMMYPSHYPSGHLGLKNPAAFPGKVIAHGLEIGTPVFKNTRAEVRPWIQAFNLGATYDATKIREEIDTVEKYTDAGWMLWNAANRYTTAGLRGEVGTASL